MDRSKSNKRQPVGNGLIVTSVRVHPDVMARVRDMQKQGDVNFNEFLIFACGALEAHPKWRDLVKNTSDRSSLLAQTATQTNEQEGVPPGRA